MKTSYDTFFRRWFCPLVGFAVLILSANSFADDKNPPATSQPADVKAQRLNVLHQRIASPRTPTTGPAAVKAAAAAQRANRGNAAKKENHDKAPGTVIPAPTVVLKDGEVPAIKFDEPTFDFGRVEGGPDVSHEYTFTNTGTGPLELLNVKPSCGCTTAGDYDKIVQPGKKGKIPVKISTRKATGNIHKTITVHTNGTGESAMVILHLQGEVWQPIQIKPLSASFARISSEEIVKGKSTKLEITNNLDTLLKLEEPQVSEKSFKAELKTIEAGKKYELLVTMQQEHKSGSISGNITINTGLKERPVLEIPVYAFITEVVDVSPDELVLPTSRTNSLQRQIYIRATDQRKMKISDIQSSNPALKLQLSDVRDGTIYQLIVEIPSTYTPPTKGDTITMKTDHPKTPKITIPIRQSAIPESTISAAPGNARRAGTTFNTATTQSVGSPQPNATGATPSTPAKSSDASKTPAAGAKDAPKGNAQPSGH